MIRVFTPSLFFIQSKSPLSFSFLLSCCINLRPSALSVSKPPPPPAPRSLPALVLSLSLSLSHACNTNIHAAHTNTHVLLTLCKQPQPQRKNENMVKQEIGHKSSTWAMVAFCSDPLSSLSALTFNIHKRTNEPNFPSEEEQTENSTSRPLIQSSTGFTHLSL